MANESLHVLRLCSVFEPPAALVDQRAGHFDGVGGMQNHTGCLVRALDAAGVQQTVVTSRLGGPTSHDRIGDGVDVHRVGLPVHRGHEAWSIAALGPALSARRHVDLVHAHQGEDLAVLPLALAAARRYRCPLVVTVHCSIGSTLQAVDLRHAVLKMLGGAPERSMLRHTDAVVFLTEESASAASGTVEAARSFVIPSGAEPGLFAAGAEDVSPDVPKPRVGFVGRLARQKDVPTLVEAFGLLDDEKSSLLLVGDGPDRDRVAAAVDRLTPAARARVHRRGFVPHETVPAVLQHLDVMVLPSVYEELGSILVEAMHCGLPVVATAVGGIPTAVDDGRTGILVPPGEPFEMAAAIDRLLADDGLRARMGHRARERAAGYSWDELGGRVLNLYRTLTNGPRARATRSWRSSRRAASVSASN